MEILPPSTRCSISIFKPWSARESQTQTLPTRLPVQPKRRSSFGVARPGARWNAIRGPKGPLPMQALRSHAWGVGR